MNKRSAVLMAGLLCATALGYEAKPIPCGPEANTGSNYLSSAGIPFFARQFAMTCPLDGDPAHVCVADRLTRREAMRMARWIDTMGVLHPDPAGESKALVEAGCTHPMVCYVNALESIARKKPDEALRCLDSIQAPQTAAGATNSIVRACLQYGRWKARPTPQGMRELESAMFDALTDASLGTNWSRQAFNLVIYAGLGESTALFERLREAAAAGGSFPDPWVTLMIEGLLEYKQGWDARGGGYANTVTQEGWKGYGEHMAKMNEVLEKAWRLHPEHPESSKIMLTAHPGDADASRMWFDRCVEAEFDYIPAYRVYTFMLRPRWGGSLEEMQAFAEECLETRRYDTEVPHQYIECVTDIAEELRDDWASALTRPGVYDVFKKLADRHGETGEFSFRSSVFHNTALLFAAYANEDAPMFRTVAAKVTTPSGSSTLDKTSRPPSEQTRLALLNAWASQERQGEQLQALDLLARRRQFDEALAGFQKLADDGALQVNGKDLAAFWQVLAGIERSIEREEWFSLIPSIGDEKGYGPWTTFGGGATVAWKDGTYWTASDFGLLVANFPLPNGVKYKIHFAKRDTSPAKGTHLGLGLSRSSTGSPVRPVVWLEKPAGADAWTLSLIRTDGRNNLERAPLGIPEDAPRKLEHVVGDEIDLFVSVSHGDFSRVNPDGSREFCSDAISVEVNGVRTHDKVPIPHECFYSDSDWSSRRPELQLGNGIVTRFRAKVKPIAH